VLATFAVGFGIIWEHGPSNVRVGANRLVIGGIIVETLCSVALFAYDANVIGVQNDKIIGLETRIAPRVITDDQYDAIQSLRGKVTAVAVLASPDTEPAMFSAQLQAALVDAGIDVEPIPSHAEDRFVGAQLCFSDDENPKDNPLWDVLSAIGMNPAADCSIKDRLQAAKGVPVIVVGERPPYFPNGAPKSFKMRVYPGFQGNP
jgi:hypothetical protein